MIPDLNQEEVAICADLVAFSLENQLMFEPSQRDEKLIKQLQLLLAKLEAAEESEPRVISRPRPL